MKTVLAVMALFAIATAYPQRLDSPVDTYPEAISNLPSDGTNAANCESGRDYCYQQIIEDLSKLIPLQIYNFTQISSVEVPLPLSFTVASISLITALINSQESTSRLSSTSTARRRLRKTPYRATYVCVNPIPWIIAMMDLVLGTRCLRARKSRVLTSRRGAIGARRASVSELQDICRRSEGVHDLTSSSRAVRSRPPVLR
jgi:hypothetical protein